VVTPDYFRALGIPLRAGRFFTDRDVVGAHPPASGNLAVVVDEALARRHWPGQDPLGKRINTSIDPDTVWSTVVGVVGHVRSGSLQSEGEPQIYLPFFQRPRATLSVVVRGRGAAERDPIRLAAAVRAAVRATDREQPIAKMHTMGELVERATARQRFNLLLLSIFAASALLLAAVGIYGVMSYTVAQRTSEIGIRMALGARPADVLRLVVGQGMRVALAGIAAGVAGAALLSRAMAGLLFGIRATDVVTYVGIAVLLAGVALVASYLPARRATRIDPLAALRSE
jgi:putative ABC transport system permease protein